MIFAHRTDIGRRKTNQDFFHVPDEKEMQLAIVADGMGGHRAGEVASRKAVEAMLEYSEGKQALSPRELLEHAVSYANRSVFELACSDEEYAGMGTTIVAAYFENESFTFANVGDSRLYHFSGERLTQLSSDHSLVEELVQSGVITRRQAEGHPQRNILTRAVGCTVKGTKTAIVEENAILNDELDKSIEDIVAQQTEMTPAVAEITFIISGTEYTAEEGMTWAEWVGLTQYSKGDFHIEDSRVKNASNQIVRKMGKSGNTPVTPDMEIIGMITYSCY